MKIEVIKGDITKLTTEAIVNAANNEFWMGSGVAGAIKAAGGESIEKDAMAKGPVNPGEAVFSTAGKLRFNYIIHAAVMGQGLRTSQQLIRQATISSLNIAEKLNIKSLAFPAFGTGVGNFPMKACANIMIGAVIAYEKIFKNIELVNFCLLDEYGYVLFKEALDKKLSP